MCHFVSWIQHDNRQYFLTGKQVFGTLKGKELQKHVGDPGDLVGHGAIRHYYNLAEGVGENMECAGFSTPSNFPDAIAKAIKNGSMRGLATPEWLLTVQALKAYNKATAPARKVYNEAVAPALKAYNKATAPARKAYYEAIAPASKVYNEAVSNSFWDLFAIPGNRIEAWR